ncbi:MAG: hypothetical protein QNJ38_21710 [Prochloraceae cyanobacterium]|nr:hypothetical protein [Prochloraceae cyanobacterium]
MKIKELAITGTSIFSLVGLIVVAVHPQSSMVQIIEKPTESSPKIRVVKVREKAAPVPVEEVDLQIEEDPQDVNLERVAQN